MKMHQFIISVVAAGGICCSFMSWQSKPPEATALVPYPEGYPQWTHVKTAVIQPGHLAFDHFGGYHHIYANPLAMEGYKTGHFKNGAVLVFDVLEAVEKDNLLIEGNRRLVDVMVRDSIKYASTGGWGFEEFKGNSKEERTIKSTAATNCYSCHASQASHHFVFSTLRP